MFLATLPLVAGCGGCIDDEQADAPLSLDGLTLRLIVAGDPPLADAVAQLRSEWEAQTGCKLLVQRISEDDLAAAAALEADAVICPSYQLGPLAQRQLLAPLPAAMLDHEKNAWDDVLPLLRHREATWGSTLYAVPFGSPVWICYYRADLLDRLDRDPPQTWQQYQELAALLSDPATLGLEPADDAWAGVIEPLAPDWAGLVLLARAASYATHRENYSTLFDVKTMQPLIDGPPFVRALEELVAASKCGPATATAFDPATARAAFWEGRCGMTITWPSATADLPAVDENVRCGLIELPGSTEVYDVARAVKVTRPRDEDPRVPLLALEGRLGVVSAKSEHVEAAFQLLFWLSGTAQNPPPGAASPHTTLFRNSHASAPDAWVESPLTGPEAPDYAEVVSQALSRPGRLFALRIPGRSEYLASLDLAIADAVSGKHPATDALRTATQQWQQITESHGVESQREAYLHSLGLGD